MLFFHQIKHTFKDTVDVGRVIGQVPGFPEWYNIKYDNDPAIYTYKLQEDYKRGDLKIIV